MPYAAQTSTRLRAVLSTVACVISLTASACTKDQVFKGRLVDEVCYVADPRANSGDNHPGMASDCATTCAQKGSTVAIVTDNGKLYAIAGALAADNNAKLVPHMAHTVEIRGDVIEEYGQLTIVAADLKMLHR
jgi:putative hemolysin